MLWIKEVEMDESVDELKSSCSIRGTQGPDFQVLDAKIASALNRIILSTRFKKKVSLEEMKAQQEITFLRWRQIAYLIYEYFRVTGANDSEDNCADLFTVVLRNDDILEFDSKWDGIFLSMTQIPSDEILEGSYKLVILRVWETQDRIGNCTIRRFIRRNLDLIITNWKLWWREVSSRKLRMKNFEARNGNYGTKRRGQESEGTKQRNQRSQGDCWQWNATGQCSEGDNCCFRHDMNKRAKSTQPNPSPRSSTRQSVKKCIENQKC